MQEYFKTPLGTELPLLNLRGKPYLQVAHRLVWFREEQPQMVIKTTAIDISETHSIFKAEIFDSVNSTVPLVNAHKREDAKHFADHMEKAETGAIGRALALLGYGTQFAPEIEEGERLADAPVTQAKKPKDDNAIYLEQIFTHLGALTQGMSSKDKMGHMATWTGTSKIDELKKYPISKLKDISNSMSQYLQGKK